MDIFIYFSVQHKEIKVECHLVWPLQDHYILLIWHFGPNRPIYSWLVSALLCTG